MPRDGPKPPPASHPFGGGDGAAGTGSPGCGGGGGTTLRGGMLEDAAGQGARGCYGMLRGEGVVGHCRARVISGHFCTLSHSHAFHPLAVTLRSHCIPHSSTGTCLPGLVSLTPHGIGCLGPGVSVANA